MGIKHHGTVTVPSAGLRISVASCADSTDVQLQVTRHGIPIAVSLSIREAVDLRAALTDAIWELRADAAGVAA